MIKLVYLMLIIIILLYAIRKLSNRIILFSFTLFLITLSDYVLVVPERTRLVLMVIITVTGYKDLLKTISNVYIKKEMLVVLLWYTYLAISNIFISGKPTTQPLAYGTIGNMLVYAFTVTYVVKASYQQMQILIGLLALGYLANIIVYIPRVLPILAIIPHNYYYHHGYVGLSCYKITPLVLYTLEYTLKNYNKAILYLVILLVTTIVFLSGARTGLIGTILIIAMYKRTFKWLGTALLIVAVIYLVVEPNSKSDWAEERYGRLYTAFRAGDPESVSEVEFRFEHFRMGVNAFIEKPICGYGYGSWNEIRGSSLNMIGSILAAHNGYAILLGETGAVGTVLFFIVVLFHIQGLPKNIGSNRNETLGYISLLAILSYVVLGINSTSFWYRDFAIYLGLANAAKARKKMNDQRKLIFQGKK